MLGWVEVAVHYYCTGCSGGGFVVFLGGVLWEGTVGGVEGLYWAGFRVGAFWGLEKCGVVEG